MEALNDAVSLSNSSVFVPWQLEGSILDMMRMFGCALRVGHYYSSFVTGQYDSFMEACNAGVCMLIIFFVVSDAMTDVVLPVACEFA